MANSLTALPTQSREINFTRSAEHFRDEIKPLSPDSTSWDEAQSCVVSWHATPLCCVESLWQAEMAPMCWTWFGAWIVWTGKNIFFVLIKILLSVRARPLNICWVLFFLLRFCCSWLSTDLLQNARICSVALQEFLHICLITSPACSSRICCSLDLCVCRRSCYNLL